MPSKNLIRRAAALASIVALGATLAACTNDPVAEQYLSGDSKGYISGEFQVQEIAPDDRGEPVAWSGVTEHGDELSSDDTAGKVTVVNFWYADCAPCRTEAPHLEKVWQDHQDGDVAFVGINVENEAETARSFAEKFGITYPSLIDGKSGEAKLAFAAATPLQATPITLVLDREGRVAARIISAIDSPSVLNTLVDDVLEEAA